MRFGRIYLESGEGFKTSVLYWIILITSLSCGTGHMERLPQSSQTAKPAPTIVKSKSSSPSNSPLRSIDFANFTFPFGKGSPESISLQNGKQGPIHDDKGQIVNEGVILESIVYGDATGDGLEEAIVVLSIVTGGSAIPHITYIYTAHGYQPKLLWEFTSGDRANGGLRQVYAENGQLVIELYGKDRVIGKELYRDDHKGDCCPKEFTRTRYEWRDNRFRQVGTQETLPNPEGYGSSIMPPYQPPN